MQADQGGGSGVGRGQATALLPHRDALGQGEGFGKKAWKWVVLALVVGLILRVLFFRDMEYKGDERWTFERTQAVGVSEPFPWVGMQTSASSPSCSSAPRICVSSPRITSGTPASSTQDTPGTMNMPFFTSVRCNAISLSPAGH